MRRAHILLIFIRKEARHANSYKRLRGSSNSTHCKKAVERRKDKANGKLDKQRQFLFFFRFFTGCGNDLMMRITEFELDVSVWKRRVAEWTCCVFCFYFEYSDRYFV